MTLRAGTSGFSYDAWKGAFYPDDLPASRRLEYYAGELPAVELNNTFYRMPRRSVLEGWAEQVPDAFRFAIKASRRITHQRRLKEADEEMGFLTGNLEALGAKLGCVLFQLPPNLKLDLARLQRFLELVPDGMRAAFEFRHPSWRESSVFDALHARECAWVGVDDEGKPLDVLVQTACWGYVRLRGSDYGQAALSRWASRLQATDWDETFVFFKHEKAGAGPRMAASLIELASRDPERPSVRPVRVSDAADREVG